MTMLTVNIEDKKTERAVKAVLHAFGLNYSLAKETEPAGRPLNKSEQAIYKSLKRSMEEVKLHKEGKIKLQSARDFLDEL